MIHMHNINILLVLDVDINNIDIELYGVESVSLELCCTETTRTRS